MEQTLHCVLLLKEPQQRTKTPICVDLPRHLRVSLVPASFTTFSWQASPPQHSIFTRTDPPRFVDNVAMLLRLEQCRFIPRANHSCNDTNNRVNQSKTCSLRRFWCCVWLDTAYPENHLSKMGLFAQCIRMERSRFQPWSGTLCYILQLIGKTLNSHS